MNKAKELLTAYAAGVVGAPAGLFLAGGSLIGKAEAAERIVFGAKDRLPDPIKNSISKVFDRKSDNIMRSLATGLGVLTTPFLVAGAINYAVANNSSNPAATQPIHQPTTSAPAVRI